MPYEELQEELARRRARRPLPEKIEPAHLGALNQALAALFEGLRSARNLPPGETHGRLGAAVALGTVWGFLIRFEAALAEGLHVPILSLHSALLALNENNVEPILKPTKRTGRATSSPRRFALIGIAVGAAQQLEWTGLSPMDANKAVAAKLNALGVTPTRGKGGVTADTLRRWREKVNTTRPLVRSLPQLLESELSAEDRGWMNATIQADDMLTGELKIKIQALAPSDGGRRVLRALENSVTKMNLAENPPNPPS